MTGRWVLPGLWTWLTGAFFAAYLAAIALTFRQYGITWDEPMHLTYGEEIIRWYSSFFRDRAVLGDAVLAYYGGFFDVVAQLATRFSPLEAFETRHLINALFGVVGVLATYKVGSYLSGPATGLLAALLLALTPAFYGHSFTNPKDIPFAALSMCTVYLVLKSVRHFPDLPWGLAFRIGIIIGLALGVRVAGFLPLGYLAVGFVLWWVRSWNPRRLPQTARPVAALLAFTGRYAVICLMACLLMFAWWPAGQMTPIARLPRLITEMTHPQGFTSVLFEGRVIYSTQLPWYYLPKWLLITLPEFYFVALGVGAAFGIAMLVRMKRQESTDANRISEIVLLLLASCLPIVYAAVTHANLYDGMRHFLFILPPLVVLAASGVTSLVFKPPNRIVAIGLVVLLVGSMILTVVDMAQLHPYQTVYFNRLFAGGLRSAAESYDTDYWGSSYKEGVEWVNRHYSTSQVSRPIEVLGCCPRQMIETYLDTSRFLYVGRDDGVIRELPDLFLATTRWSCHRLLAGRVLHTVERQGTPLLYVVEVAQE